MYLRYTLNKQDYIDFNLYHMEHSATAKKARRINHFAPLAIFLVAPFIAQKFGNIPLQYWYIAFLIMSVIWLFYYPKYEKNVVVKRMTKMLDEGKNASLFAPCTVTIDENQVTNDSKAGTQTAAWTTIEKIGRTDNHIFIYNSSVSAFILPKREFSTPEALQAFESLIDSYAKQ